MVKRKITTKDIDNLPQLDRMEFRMRARDIREYYSMGSTIYLVNWATLVIAILLLLVLGVWQVNESSAQELLSVAPIIMKVVLLVIVIGLAGDAYSAYMHVKKMKELQDFHFGSKNA